MSNGFNPLSLFKPTGNPVVLKLLETKETPLNDLLDQESFPTEFRREGNEVLEKYMTYKKYLKLVEYITEIGDEKDKNRAFKYPFIAAEILSIDNSHTCKYFISSKPIIEQEIVIEEVEIEREVDSDRSFMSEISEGSIVSDESQAEKESLENNENEELEQQMPEIQVEKRPSEIDEDDFPFIEEIKKVKKIKQKKEKIINHEYQPLINNIFEFFNKPLNHTLTGYVCKVINALLTKNSTIYPELLLKAQTTLFLSHIESRSVEELLVRILTFETQSESDITFQYNLLMLCMHKISEDNDMLVVQNLSFLVTEVIEKISEGEIKSEHFKQLLKKIIKASFFDKLCEYFDQSVRQLEDFTNDDDFTEVEITEIRIKELSKISSTFLKMLIKIKEIEEFKTDCLSVFHSYEDNYNKFTESAYKKLELEALETRMEKLKSKFGMTKILLIDIIFTFIRENLGFCQQILAEKHCFFEIILQLVKKSPFNSILHNSVFSIWNFFVKGLKKENENQTIIGSLFRQAFDIESKYGLLHFSQETFEENESLSITQKKGYTGHLLKIFTEIFNLPVSKDDELIKKLKESIFQFKSAPEWSYIVSHQIEPHLERTKRNLGSYTKRRDIKASIEFDKNLILENFKEFLKGTKFTTLDEFENFDEEESDTEEEKNHLAGRVTISKETEHEIEEMEREEFEINAGLKTNFNNQEIGDITKDSINSNE